MRLEITRRADLAVRAMVILGSSEHRLKAPTLARQLGTTAGFVPQIVGPLVKAGWVRSDPGPTGGYTSRIALGDVSVLEVIEVIEGVTEVGRCVVGDHPCDRDPSVCSLHVAWGRARRELVGALDATSLADIAAG